ncbi:hypothetical protein GCM10027162_21440 [Streptomyces incanus]
MAAEEVYVVVLKRGEPGEQLVGDREAVGGELLDGGADVESGAGAPRHGKSRVRILSREGR